MTEGVERGEPAVAAFAREVGAMDDAARLSQEAHRRHAGVDQRDVDAAAVRRQGGDPVPPRSGRRERSACSGRSRSAMKPIASRRSGSAWPSTAYQGSRSEMSSGANPWLPAGAFGPPAGRSATGSADQAHMSATIRMRAITLSATAELGLDVRTLSSLAEKNSRVGRTARGYVVEDAVDVGLEAYHALLGRAGHDSFSDSSGRKSSSAFGTCPRRAPRHRLDPSIVDPCRSRLIGRHRRDVEAAGSAHLLRGGLSSANTVTTRRDVEPVQVTAGVRGACARSRPRSRRPRASRRARVCMPSASRPGDKRAGPFCSPQHGIRSCTGRDVTARV